MKGAITGDVVGSIYEFDPYFRKKQFDLIQKESTFTDDTVLTVAVMEIILNNKANDLDFIGNTFRKYGIAYPHAGYGCSFSRWLMSGENEPYESFGNGAAMRISPVGMAAQTEEECIEMAKMITSITHNHPEGLKGGMVTALCVFYAKNGKTKEEIKQFVEQYYDIDFDYEELRRTYYFNETCQNTVPQAIYCFLISKDFEDCLRTSVSIGGDTDTLCAISCGIAEAYYKNTNKIFETKIEKLLPKSFKKIIKKFYKKYGD